MKVSLNQQQRTILFSIMDSNNCSVSEVLAQAFGLLVQQQEQEQHRLQGEQNNANNQEGEALP